MCSLIKSYKNFYYNREFENSIKYNGINFSRVAMADQNFSFVTRGIKSKLKARFEVHSIKATY